MLRLLLIVSILCCAVAAVAAAKPAPPGQLHRLFRDFLHGEEFLEKHDWAGFQRWQEQIARDLHQLTPLLRQQVPAPQLDSFERTLDDLRRVVHARDAARARRHFLATHKQLLALFDGYENRIPPALTQVYNDLEEALAGVQSRDLGEIRDELQEVELFYGTTEAELRRRGMAADEIERFRNGVAQLQQRLLTGEPKAPAGTLEEVARQLTELQRLLAAQQKWLAAR